MNLRKGVRFDEKFQPVLLAYKRANNPLDQGYALQKGRDLGYSDQQLRNGLNICESELDVRFEILGYPEYIQSLVRELRMTPSVARFFATQCGDDAPKYIDALIRAGKSLSHIKHVRGHLIKFGLASGFAGFVQTTHNGNGASAKNGSSSHTPLERLVSSLSDVLQLSIQANDDPEKFLLGCDRDFRVDSAISLAERLKAQLHMLRYTIGLHRKKAPKKDRKHPNQ